LVIDSLSNENIRDIIHAISFLTLFILQKAFNHFIASLHMKPNEILYSSSTVDKSVINVGSKTEPQIIELQKEYHDPAKQSKTGEKKEDDEPGEDWNI